MSATRTAVREPDSEPAEPDNDDLTADAPALDDDDAFHLLQCRRRRDALRYLAAEDGGPVEMRELAEQVAAWEHDTTVAALASDQRQRVYIPLYQTHLPKLDEAGVVEYDQDRGTVARGPNAGRLERYLRVGDDEATPGPAAGGSAPSPEPGDAEPAADGGPSTPWSGYVAGAAVAGLVALGAAGLLAPGSTGWLALAVVVVGAVGLVAQVVEHRRRQAAGTAGRSGDGG